MKESLAARQAALLRQNAELDQKVEAIEQRRQQQLQNAKATATSASNVTNKGHEISLAEPASTVAAFSDDEHSSLDGDAMRSPERVTSAASRLGLKRMNLSASIDSAGKAPDKAEKNDSETVGTQPPRSVTMAAARRKSHLKRDKSLDSLTAGTAGSDSARKPLRRHRTGLAGDGSVIHETKREAESLSPDTTQGGVDEDDLGLEATVRYQKARLRVLQDELDVAQRDLKDMQAAQQQSKATIEELTAENATLKKKQLQTQQLLDKQQDLSAAQESKQKILETQLSTAQAKMDELQRAEKQASQQSRTKDVRLNRALEELEKVKTQLHDERRVQGDQSVSKVEYEQVIKDNKRLDKQKNELLLAFKKQMKLIDLLKRQRIHMEAAKMLSFTEEEFSKTLELG